MCENEVGTCGHGCVCGCEQSCGKVGMECRVCQLLCCKHSHLGQSQATARWTWAGDEGREVDVWGVGGRKAVVRHGEMQANVDKCVTQVDMV